MTPEELHDPVQHDEDAWNARDPDRLAALFAPDLEYRSVTLPQPLHGREGFRDLAARYMRALPDLRIENNAAALGGDVVVIEWRITATHLGPLDTVPEVDEYWDLLSLLKQLGPRALAVGGARKSVARLRARLRL